MYPYQPKPWHMLTVSVPIFIIGAFAFRYDEIIGTSIIVIGWASVITIALAHAWSNVIEHNKSKQYMMDSAKHLTNDQLMIIFGLQSKPKETVTARIVYEDRHGQMEHQRNFEPSISSLKLQALAIYILNGGTFSRPAICNERKIMSDPEFRTVLDEFKRNNLIALKEQDKPNLGYEFTKAGIAFLTSLIESPSPTQIMEMS